MENTLKAELLSVGTELLRGEITDTNATFLASQLPLLGFELLRITTAGDSLPELGQILQQAMQRTDIIITTGGLGPTQDDLTREAVAALLQEKLTVDPQLENGLRSFFARFGREMPPHNIKQAMLIPSAVALPNPRGTAPGWWVEKSGKVIALLPGPPREMTFMWQNEVLPRIRQRFPVKTILTRTIKTFLIQEAKVAELAQPFFKSDNPTLGIYAKPDGIQVRFVAAGDKAAQLLDEAEKKLTEKLSPYVWGKDNDKLENIIGQWLRQRQATLATGEIFTGGLLATIITATPENEKFYGGGEVSELTKINSAPDCEAAAQSLRRKYKSDFGLCISSINPASEVFIAIDDDHGVKSWRQQYQPGRPDNRERAATAALFRLRERLIELNLNK